MYALRKFLYKPKKSDPSLLAQFYYADEDLCLIAAELDTLDGRKNPTKCAALVARLRQYQHCVLRLVQLIIDDTIPDGKASRDFRVKYPDDLIQEGLAGQLWFGAECLAAGSSILNREVESESMRPLAKSLTKQIDQLRTLLRDQSLRDPLSYTDRIKQALSNFDATFAEFELSYVSAMVPVKTMKEYDMIQEVTVLFSETVDRAVSRALITRDMVDYYDPALMFTIPRLAIVSGLVIFPEGPLNPTVKACNISEMFRPFQTLLKRIRELLWTLSQDELIYLERLLCNMEEKSVVSTVPVTVDKECKKTGKSRQSKVKEKRAASSSASLFSEIADLVTSTSSNSSRQPPPNDGTTDGLSGDDNSNNSDQADIQPSSTAQESVIINDETTGEARLVHRPAPLAHSESDGSAGSPTADNHSSEPQVNRGQEQSNSDAHTGASSEFSFHLPSGQPGRHVTISRSLSQDGGRVDATPLIDLDQSSDSDSGTESSVSSDSETSSNSEELRHQQGQLMQSLLDARTDGVRNRYRNTDELLQKLFICVSGVADQLQTNFASDLRNILKQVFDMQSSEMESPKINKSWDSQLSSVQSPPTWIPDSEMDKCGSCRMPFTFVRRRHHCRNCGLIFCSRCSSNSAPLPNYGYEQAVRICNKCYVYRVNPFYMDQDAGSSSSSTANSQARTAT